MSSACKSSSCVSPLILWIVPFVSHSVVNTHVKGKEINEKKLALNKETEG